MTPDKRLLILSKKVGLDTAEILESTPYTDYDIEALQTPRVVAPTDENSDLNFSLRVGDWA